MSFSSSFFPVAVLLAAVLSPVNAQTFTSCNPTWTNITGCPDDPALGTHYTFDFSQANVSTVWNTTDGTIAHTSNGGEFTVSKSGDSPTMQSDFYIFFGSVEVHMKAATGQGIISSIVLESDDLDEVDWEIMGGNNTHVETNYFGKGNTTVYDRAIYYPVDKPLETFHNYTVHWTSDKIEWYIDTKLVRTLLYADANGGHNFPQTPMNVRIGAWAAGDPAKNSNGTIEWAGGLTDFTKGPFTMYVLNVTATDQSNGSSSYHYSDHTGSWQSIKAIS
jgi:beta-glucanase (GH16 family)